MAVVADTITLPAFWASALINGDTSGMTPKEISHMHQYLAGYPDTIVDVGEPYFTWSYDLYGGTCRGGEVATYTVLREE